MYKVDLRLECKNPKLVKKSLEPDIRNDKYTNTVIETNKSFIIIKIKSKKLSYLKAMINSYLSLVNTIEEMEKSDKNGVK